MKGAEAAKMPLLPRLEVIMCKIHMIRNEPGLVSIPLERAVYCENCDKVSNSAWRRCGLCGSEAIVELASILSHPFDPGPAPGAATCSVPVAA
jgi:hypothetical protein